MCLRPVTSQNPPFDEQVSLKLSKSAIQKAILVRLRQGQPKRQKSRFRVLTGRRRRKFAKTSVDQMKDVHGFSIDPATPCRKAQLARLMVARAQRFPMRTFS